MFKVCLLCCPQNFASESESDCNCLETSRLPPGDLHNHPVTGTLRMLHAQCLTDQLGPPTTYNLSLNVKKKNAILSQSLICFLFSSSCKEVDVLFYCGWPLRRRTRFHVDMCGYHVCVMEIEVRESVIYITKISSVSVHLSLFVTTSCGIFICHLLIVPAPYYFYQFPVALV